MLSQNTSTTTQESHSTGCISEPERYLHALFGNESDNSAYTLSLWVKRGKQGKQNRTLYFPATEAGIANAAKQVRVLSAGNWNVYCHVCLHDRALMGKRGTVESAAMLPGLYADIDYGTEHQGKKYPPDLPAALSLVDAIPLQPTLVIHSGRGVHVYWLFKELWDLTEAADHAAAELLLARLHKTLKQAAARHDWAVDNVMELGRVLRIPGTVNRKAGCEDAPVTILQHEDDRRYTPDDFDDILLPAEEKPQAEPEEEEPASEQPRGFPGSDAELIAFASQAKNGAKFQALWKGDTSGYASPSEADLALMNLLAFWTGKDPARMDALFRQSGLMRPKWDEQRGKQTYGAKTIREAIAGTQETYSAADSVNALLPQARKLTDLGNAERLIDAYGENLLYCKPFKSWLVWDGKRWAIDDTLTAMQLAQRTVRTIYEEAAAFSQEAASAQDEAERNAFARRAEQLLKHATKSEAAERVRALLTMAQPQRAILPNMLDENPWLLNVGTGTLDLQTGKLQPHRQADRLTKITPTDYDPQATCPRWVAFLDTIFQGDTDLMRFVQKGVGYSLTGDVSEQCLFLLYGSGANGKSTFLGIIHKLLSDYAAQADFASFLRKNSDSIPNDLAMLRGARFVAATEAEQNRKLAEVLVKQLTGGDPVTARFLHQEYFTFSPQMKLWLSSNHKPQISGTDDGIWRRIRLIPFDVQFKPTDQDKALPMKLAKELPGILAWAVAGCQLWQREGLEPPQRVVAHTEAYRKEEDTLGEFLAECCLIGVGHCVRASKLLNSFREWTGDRTISQTAFGRQLRARGFQKQKLGTVLYSGIRLHYDFEEWPAADPDDE